MFCVRCSLCVVPSWVAVTLEPFTVFCTIVALCAVPVWVSVPVVLLPDWVSVPE